jgi:hypothetical protein
MTKLKHQINKWIDSLFDKKTVLHEHKPMTNQLLMDNLKGGFLYVACIVAKKSDPKKPDIISDIIVKATGPFSHVVLFCDQTKFDWLPGEEKRINTKLGKFYKSWEPFQYLVLGSADKDGMNYHDLSTYQNRKMFVYALDTSYEKSCAIISEFLTARMMKAKYDYTGLVGHLFRAWKWLYSKFDDEKAYYCSEQADELRKFGVLLSLKRDSNPTQIYEFCRDRYRCVYYNY